jgi:hypothetical protein
MLSLAHSLLPFLILSSCTHLSQKLPTAFESMNDCNTNSRIVKSTLKDLKNNPFHVYWTEAAPDACPGPQHPRLMLEAHQVSEWIQIIEVSLPPDPALKGYQNLSTTSWSFLDISPESAKKKSFFYNHKSSPYFHDNPLWTNQQNQDWTWSARLYGLQKNPQGSLRPILALSWGFGYKNKSPVPYPVPPVAIDISRWKIDYILLQKIAQNWNVPLPVGIDP